MKNDLEKKVMRKVTLRIIPFIMLLYFIAFLDRVNIGFAALTMNQDLGFSPTVFGLGAGIFFLGYFLFEVPSNLILHKVGARIWIARVMITWGFVSGCMAFVQGTTSFYILRFLLGVAEAGFFPVEWLETYQHANSHLPGHTVRQKTPGIELNTGALGHGLPVAVGLALAAKKSNSTRRIFLITGDGELAEGSNWEAALAAAHYGLDNLVIINDKNNLQLAGPTREIMNTDPLADKWRAFGMEVSECQGNDMASVVSVIEGLKQEGKPNVIIANTTKGAGISFIQGRPEWHHRVPKGEEIALALEELKDE